jgi:hypothetical protein
MTQLMETEAGTRSRTWRDDWPLAVAVALAAAGDWMMATQAAGVDLAVGSGSGTRHIGVVSVVVTAVVVTLAASGLLRFLESRSSRGRTIWTVIAVVVALLSLAGPLGATSFQAGMWLVSLHALVGTAVLFGLRRSRVCA